MVSYEELLEAGVHFGHLSRKWHPAMASYIFMERNKIHIIDLMKTQKMLDDACKIIKQLSKQGRKVLFVGTKKQAQEIISNTANEINQPYVTNRWLGGMLTNFATIRKSVKRLQQIEKMENDGTFDQLVKKERLDLTREKDKLNKILGGITEMIRQPGALFIVDIKKEHIAVAEARKLGIPTIGLVDTNSDPNLVDYPIPGNDDAAKSIKIIADTIANAIKEGVAERKLADKEAEAQQKEHPIVEAEPATAEA